MKKPLQLDLLENARSFIVEALKKAVAAEQDSAEWKFAILHIVQAIELSLKELLRVQHPVLIYKNVDKPDFTVTLEQALSRLKQLTSFEPTEDEKRALKVAALLRNNIVHHEFKADPVELKAAFSHLFGFLVDFHRENIEFPLEDEVPPDLWIAGIKIKDYGEELFRRAQARMKQDDIGEESVIACPKCGWEALSAFGDNQERCYVCGNVEHLVVCEKCSKVMLWGEHEELNKKDYCFDCLAYLTDDYWYESARDNRG